MREARSDNSFDDLSPVIKKDVVLCIAEAFRFPGIEWKRFTIGHTKEIIRHMNDDYVQSCIAQRESLLSRVTNEVDHAFHVLEDALASQIPNHGDKKHHASFGYTAIQRALNHIQLEQLAEAKEAIHLWEPTSKSPTAMEHVVLFRKHTILGKILRYQGDFKESLTHLEMSKCIADQHKDITFLEDGSDLTCSLADSFLELDDPISAEDCLRTEIARQDPDSVGMLKLALAESLFAQNRYSGAEGLCLEVQSQPRLLKMGKLRLSIIRARLSHIRAEYDEAFRYWTDAMTAVRRFTLSNGHTTRIILISLCDLLHRQRRLDLEFKSRNQLRTLEQLARPAGALYWIAGLRHWLNYLESDGMYHRRSHI